MSVNRQTSTQMPQNRKNVPEEDKRKVRIIKL
jgi:hypothetical protein